MLRLSLCYVLLTGAAFALGQNPSRTTTELATNWHFHPSDAAGAEAPTFDDSTWTTVTVPNDWAIAGPFSQDNKSGGAGAWLPYGISWYRRAVELPSALDGRSVRIEFDGVMANSQVWFNGHLLGARPYGYVSFAYDVTPYAHPGGGNILAVRTDTSKQPASRWYEGAGIYRKVRLVVQQPTHIAHWGTFITTPQVSAASATVNVATQIEGQQANTPITLRVHILSPTGASVAKFDSKPGTATTLTATGTVPHPDRWDLNHGALYRAHVELIANNRILDAEDIPFGIREFHFDADTGFWINGRNVKLLGACLHEDAGAFGIAVPKAAYIERFRALQALGVNAIRAAHNPPSPEFLAAADELGLAVMDEMFDAWSVGKNPYDYHLDFAQWHVQDTLDTAMRDRNHPSIVLYSAGNEIHDTPKPDLAKPELASIVAAFHQADPTRPVTQALFRPNVSHDYDDGLADELDVVGQNYRPNEILAAHAQKPTRKIVGTENTHDRDQWLAVRDHPEYSGQFLWAGADYLGEAGAWPNISRSNGLLDRTNAPHTRALERQSWWVTATPVVHIVRRVKPRAKSPTDPGYEPSAVQLGGAETTFADWTPESLDAHTENVEVYSNCPQVELSLNGTSLGTKPIHPDASPRTWEVTFAPGKLAAFCSGPRPATETLTTAGKPDHLVLTPTAPTVGTTFDDAVSLRAVVVDANGIRVPRSTPMLSFAIEGPAAILAVDNADNRSHEPFQATQRSAYDGEAIAWVRAKGAGELRITVSSPDLHAAKATITGH